MNEEGYGDCAKFLRFLRRHGTLRHGSFLQRSGRVSPFVFDLSLLDSALAVSRVGQRMAALIADRGGADVICGPAYSGIPLALAAAIEYSRLFNESVSVLYARKQSKRFVEERLFDGPRPRNGERVVLVDEVIASGRTLDELVSHLRTTFRVAPKLAVVCVDRQERGFRTRASAATELQRFRNVRCAALTNAETFLRELAESSSRSRHATLDLDRIRAYYADYGSPRMLHALRDPTLVARENNQAHARVAYDG